MLILFLIVILFIFLLIFFASGATTKPTRTRPPRTRPRVERSHVPLNSLPEPEIEPLIQPQPKFRPEMLRDAFVPIARSQEVEQQQLRLSDAEISEVLTPPPAFTGRERFNWDARCRLTGQTYRVCSCEGCKNLRSRNGI
jgi:hypothetical protein